MDFIYEPIIIKRKTLVDRGVLRLSDTGVCLLHGNNGTGKTLLLNNIHANSNGLTVLVSQDNNDIITEIGVAENIAMTTLEPDLLKTRSFLEKYNLAYLLDLTPSKMSGGEKRIVCLLRGILSSAPFVLIDEPTNDLDFEMVKKVVEIIIDSSKEKSFLIVTHNDRLKSIADNSIVIIGNKLRDKHAQRQICLHFRSDRDYDFQISTDEKQPELRFIKRFWNRQVINLVSVLIMVILFSLSIYKVLQREIITEGQAYLPPNQISIMVPHSVYGSSTASKRYGTYPITLMSSILSGNLWFNARSISESVKKEYSNKIVFLPELKSTEDYSLYPLEYFADRHYVYPLDLYLTYLVESVDDECWIDTSEFFYHERNVFSGRKHSFDPLLFKESVEAVETLISKYGNTYKPVFYTVVFNNNYTLTDFLGDLPEEFLIDGIFIQTSETILVGTKVEAILQYQAMFKDIIRAGLILLTIELFYTFIYCSVKIRNIKILKNYGYKRNKVEQKILRVTNDVGIRIVFISFFLILWMYLILGNSSQELYRQAYSFIGISVVLITTVGSYLKKIIIKLNHRVVYSWRYR